MLRLGMPLGTLCVPLSTPDLSLAQGDAERHGRHSHAERGNDQQQRHREQARSHIKQTGAQLTRRPTGRPRYSTLARSDRSHAPRGNAAGDALRSAVDTRLESCARVTRSVTGGIPTRSVGTIRTRTAFASHHSSGRALARLPLLISICPVGRECRATARHRTSGAQAFGYLAPGRAGFSK
jgi:hypothetical protein